MLIEREEVSRGLPSAELTAQQANLIRSVLREDPTYLNHTHQRHPVTGGKAVTPVQDGERRGFGEVWQDRPVQAIGSMNRAMHEVKSEARKERYVKAAVDLEIVMDRSGSEGPTENRVGIPGYLQDGYTDLGLLALQRRRERILVDKGRLKSQLVASRTEALNELSRTDVASDLLSRLRRMALSLRSEVFYQEGEPMSRSGSGTVLLSQCVEQGMLGSRHLSILMQLRLQESGISSRLVKGGLRLYGLKTRHAWNVVMDQGAIAIIDVTFAEGDTPFVIVGATLPELYARAERVNRSYQESPDTANYYMMRRPGA